MPHTERRDNASGDSQNGSARAKTGYLDATKKRRKCNRLVVRKPDFLERKRRRAKRAEARADE